MQSHWGLGFWHSNFEGTKFSAYGTSNLDPGSKWEGDLYEHVANWD